MATTITKTVRVNGGGSDYTSLAAWEAAMQGDLVANDQISIASCLAPGTSAPDVSAGLDYLLIDGWTTDATRYVSISSPVGSRHSGRWDDTKYIIAAGDIAAGYTAAVIRLNSIAYCRIDFLQVSSEVVNASIDGILSAGPTGDIYITNCLIRENTNKLYKGLAAIRGLAGNIYARNCIGYGFQVGFRYYVASSQYVGVASGCTFISNSYAVMGFAGGPAMTAINVYGAISSIEIGAVAFVNVSTMQECASSGIADGSATYYNIANSVESGAAFIDNLYGSEDFHIHYNSQLATKGAYDANNLLDIDGETRLSTYYCIGADWEAYQLPPLVSLKTVDDTDGDYTSLVAWEAGEQRNLTATGVIAKVHCYPLQSADVGGFYLAGWGTSEAYHVEISSPVGERHSGKWDSSKYRISADGFSIQTTYTVIEYLQIYLNSGSVKLEGIGVKCTILACMIKGNGTGNSVPLQVSTGNNKIINTCVTETATYCFFTDYSNGYNRFWNCIGVTQSASLAAFYCQYAWVDYLYHCYAVMQGTSSPIQGTWASTQFCAGPNFASGLQIAYSTTTGAYFKNVSNNQEDFHIGELSQLRNRGTIPIEAPLDFESETRTNPNEIGPDFFILKLAPVETKTIKQTGGDYSSVSAWEAAEQSNLVSLNVIKQALCFTMPDSIGFDVSGWTTSSFNYPLIEADASAYHNARYDTTEGYRITNARVGCYQAYTQIKGLWVQSAISFGYPYMFQMQADYVIVDRVYVEYRTTGDTMVVGLIGLGCELRNSIVSATQLYNNYCVYVESNGPVCTVIGCTVIGGQFAIYSSYGGTMAINTWALCLGVGNAFLNCTTINTSQAPFNNSNFVSTTGGGEDYHITEASALRNSPNTDTRQALDVDGQARVLPYDYGADEWFPPIVPVENKIIASSGGDYTSIVAWEAAEGNDLTLLKKIKQAECHSFSDNVSPNGLIVAGWTTSETYRAKIYSPQPYCHDGMIDGTKYLIFQNNPATTHTVNISWTNCDLIGLQIICNAQTSSYRALMISPEGVGGSILVDRCIIKGWRDNTGSTDPGGIFINSTSASFTLNVTNTMLYSGYRGVEAYHTGSINMTHCNIMQYNSQTFLTGNMLTGNVNLTNCYVGSDKGVTCYPAGNKLVLTTCASDDATGSAGLRNIAFATGSGAYFKNVATQDYHIVTPSPLQGKATATAVDTDIDGESRTTVFDVGADEIGAPAFQVITKTIKQSGGDYSSLSAWEAARQGDLTVSLIREQAECYNFVDTVQCTFAGWTTDLSHYPLVYCPDGQGHSGKWLANVYQLSQKLNVYADYAKFSRICATGADDGNNVDGMEISQTVPGNPSLVVLDRFLLAARTAQQNAIALRIVDTIVSVVNSIIYGFDYGITLEQTQAQTQRSNFQQNTIIGHQTGFVNNGVSFNMYQTYMASADNSGQAIQLFGGVSDSQYNAVNDSSIVGSGNSNYDANIAHSTTAGARFVNVTIGSEDYHIKPQSALLANRNQGAILDDIDGQTRGATGVWDCGADQLSGYLPSTANRGVTIHPRPEKVAGGLVY